MWGRLPRVLVYEVLAWAGSLETVGALCCCCQTWRAGVECWLEQVTALQVRLPPPSLPWGNAYGFRPPMWFGGPRRARAEQRASALAVLARLAQRAVRLQCLVLSGAGRLASLPLAVTLLSLVERNRSHLRTFRHDLTMWFCSEQERHVGMTLSGAWAHCPRLTELGLLWLGTLPTQCFAACRQLTALTALTLPVANLAAEALAGLPPSLQRLDLSKASVAHVATALRVLPALCELDVRFHSAGLAEVASALASDRAGRLRRLKIAFGAERRPLATTPPPTEWHLPSLEELDLWALDVTLPVPFRFVAPQLAHLKLGFALADTDPLPASGARLVSATVRFRDADQLAACCARWGATLRELYATVPNPTPGSVRATLVACPELQELRLDCPLPTEPRIVAPGTSTVTFPSVLCCPALRVLVSDALTDALLGSLRLPALEQLSDGQAGITLPTLERFRTLRCLHVSDLLLPAAPPWASSVVALRGLPLLSELRIWDVEPRATHVAWLRLLPRLTTLHVAGLRQSAAARWLHTVRACRSLRRLFLHIRHDPNASARRSVGALRTLLAGAARLEAVELRGLSRPSAFEPLLAALPVGTWRAKLTSDLLVITRM